MVVDSAYSLHTIRSRGLERFVTGWDLEGFFERVWAVHPCVGASPDDPPGERFGSIRETALTSRHTMVEGRYGRFRVLERLPLLNFLIAQLELLLALQRLIRREGIGLVRAQDPYYLALIALPLAWANRLPAAIIIQGNYDLMYRNNRLLAYPRLLRRRRVEKLIDHLTLRRADLVAGVNENNRGFAVANGAPPGKTAVFRYGITVDLIHYRPPEERINRLEELGLDGKRTLLYVGRYEPVKLPQDVVHCLAEVARQRSDVVALLVGDGALRPQLQALADELGVGDKILLLGNRDQHWLSDAYSFVDVVLAPLAGRALVEAALGGRPIVAYDVEWHGELIRDGETGRLVPYRDWRAMARVALELLDDPERATQLGRQGRE
ncbi:MAG TPA: glycosyltransferase family 4 protein, partial [Chloroflexota bacterium]